MKKVLFLFLFVSAFARVNAHTNGQIITVDGNTYQVISTSAYTLRFLGTNKSGHLDLPAEVVDGDTRFTVTEIGGNDNYGCPNVTSVVIPNTVTTLLSPSFNNANMATMEIPASVVNIAHSWGYGWSKAPSFTVDPANPNFKADSDGALYSSDGTTLYVVPDDVSLNDGTYTVDPNVTSITVCAFLKNKKLKEIVLPLNLQSVEEGTFPTMTYGTSLLEKFSIAPGGSTPYRVEDGVLLKGNSLISYPANRPGESYKVPDDITNVVRYGFNLNSRLTSIDLNNVETMAASAINYLSQLQTVTFPKNLSATGVDGAIVGCRNISAYIVPDDCVNFSGRDGVVFSRDGSTLYFYPPAKTGESYDIPSNVTNIAQYAFRGQAYLTSIKIPSAVEAIGAAAFGEIKNLADVTFEEPSHVTELSGNPFTQCESLKEVTLPTSLTRLGATFFQCRNLEVINVPDGSKLQIISENALSSNTALKHFNFMGSCELKTIDNNAFAYLENLQEFNFPASVTRIGNNAFGGCTSMTTATFADNAVIQTIGSGAFADCGLTAVTIPESVEIIENEAFRNCEVLVDVNLSANVRSIDPGAFKHCDNLYNITVDKDNAVYSSVDGYLLTADKETLVIFPPGKANSNFTLLPPSITKIGDYAFYDCQKLENVVIPNKVKAIGERAFGLCKNLNTVTFLCDEMIDPVNIYQTENEASFDYGQNGQTNMFENINTYVRKERLEEYRNNPYYQQFNVVGTTFFDNGNEYIPVSKNTADLVAVGNRDYTFVVPTTATGQVLVNPGQEQEQTYDVHLIGDYAFQGVSDDVKEVVVKQHVQYIGAKAFMTDIENNTSTIESVFFIQKTPSARMLSTTRFELDQTGNNYNEFAAGTKVYVKKSALSGYQTEWKKQVYNRDEHSYSDSPYDFTSQLDFRIPDVKIGTKYSTFAREFDTDFSDYFAEEGRNDIGAFVAKEVVRHQPGDYGVSNYHVKMTSVDMHGGYAGSYGYVPANTGVLLKVLEENNTASDFYYTIGEQDEAEYTVTENIMTGVTVNNQRVEASESNPIYVISGGTFHKVTQNINMPVHKAYMTLGEELPADAKLLLVFDDDDETVTAIDGVHVSAETSDHIYNLSGQRVADGKMNKGVYIAGGKKVVIR